MPTTEAAIRYRFWRDIYIALGDPQDGGGWAVRTYIKPFANWLWAGCIIMALGGLISLTDRRFRVAAGARGAKRPARCRRNDARSPSGALAGASPARPGAGGAAGRGSGRSRA
jgi:hypothetical protein